MASELTFGGVDVCDACLKGEGGECHTPGCSFWMNRAPDIPFVLRPAAPLDDDAAVERAAKALCPVYWDASDEASVRTYRAKAVAVIRALAGSGQAQPKAEET